MNAGTPLDASAMAEYEALTSDVAVVEIDPRTQIELSGADRATFLHNLCTSEIKRLAVGSGCETFLTSVQGKTLAHAFIFAGPDSLVIDTVGGQAKAILQHLNHYLVCEQVTLADRSDQWCEMLLAGPRAGPLVKQRFATRLPEPRLSHALVGWDGTTVWLRRIDITPAGGFLINSERQAAAGIQAALLDAGARRCGQAAFGAARLERGFPLFGIDITEQNLPQEVGRDELAISFVKGCYLGQETVARIDALGHVNKLLVGLRFSGEVVPEAGLVLMAGEKQVGQVTSAAFSPKLQAPLAFGYVRRGSETVGTRLHSALGEVEVVGLPLA